MALISQTEIDNLSETSTPAAVQRVLDLMATAARNLTHANMGVSDAYSVFAQAMPLHMVKQRAPMILSFTPSKAAGATFTLLSGQPLARMRLPPGVPPVEIVGGCVFVGATSTVPTTGAVQAELHHNGVHVAGPVVLTLAGTRFDFPAFDVTLNTDSVLDIRVEAEAGYALSPLKVHLFGKAPLIPGPISRA